MCITNVSISFFNPRKFEERKLYMYRYFISSFDLKVESVREKYCIQYGITVVFVFKLCILYSRFIKINYSNVNDLFHRMYLQKNFGLKENSYFSQNMCVLEKLSCRSICTLRTVCQMKAIMTKMTVALIAAINCFFPFTFIWLEF